MIKARLKYIIKTQKGKVPKKFSDDNTMPPYLSIDYLRGECDNILYVKPKAEYKLIDEDEVLVLYDGANAGEVMLSKQGFLSSTMAVVTPKTEFFEKRFLFYFLKSIIL
jgi:type I restriction enzyme S subunit